MKQFMIISLSSRFGGGETYLEQLTPMLRDRIQLYVFCIDPEVKRRLQALGVTTWCLNIARTWMQIFRIPAGIACLLYFRLVRGVSHVLLNGHAPAALAIPARLMGYRIYLVAHIGLTARTTLVQRLFLHRRYLTSVRFASKVICVSEPVAAELRTIFSSLEICAIPNWIATIPSLSTGVRRSDRLLSVLFVGRLVELKGLSILLSALRLLSGLSLTVVGEGEYRPQLERMAEGLAVKFVGFQPVTSSYFRDADVFVNPSRGPEGLPMVSLEAMSNGLPCILSDLPVHVGISEGGAALLFRSGDVADLADKLSQLIADEGLRRSYGNRARRTIEERYSASSATQRYLEALEVV